MELAGDIVLEGNTTGACLRLYNLVGGAIDEEDIRLFSRVIVYTSEAFLGPLLYCTLYCITFGVVTLSVSIISIFLGCFCFHGYFGSSLLVQR